MREQLEVLMIGFHEVVRQVSVHCAERGALLERIHGGIAELFEGVVAQMGGAIEGVQSRVARERARVARQQAQAGELHTRHARALDELHDTLSHRWAKRLQAYKEALLEHERLAADEKLEAERAMLHWFPLFHVYGPSALVNLLPKAGLAPGSAAGGTAAAAPPTPQEALRADIERLRQAGVLAASTKRARQPDGRAGLARSSRRRRWRQSLGATARGVRGRGADAGRTRRDARDRARPQSAERCRGRARRRAPEARE